MPIECLTLTTHIRNFEKEIKQNSSTIYSGDKHNKGDIAAKFRSYWMSGSHFIVQTSIFVDHWHSHRWTWVKVTERSYSTFPQTSTVFVPKYLKLISSGFDLRSNSFCGGGGGGGGGGAGGGSSGDGDGGNELKT